MIGLKLNKYMRNLYPLQVGKNLNDLPSIVLASIQTPRSQSIINSSHNCAINFFCREQIEKYSAFSTSCFSKQKTDSGVRDLRFRDDSSVSDLRFY